MIRRQPSIRRRGMSVVECAAVLPVTILLLMGTIVMSLGVFRYQQIQSLAREGARYASVRGPAYAQATGNPQASASAVESYVQSLSVGLNGLKCSSVSYSASSLPCTVSVTLNYTWKPEGLLAQQSWTVSSTMPVTY